MTTDDLRTRAREAAEERYSGPQWHVGTIRDRQVEAYIEGYLAHAAQQPTREQIAPKVCPERHAASGTTHEPGANIACAWSDDLVDAVLALLNGAGS